MTTIMASNGHPDSETAKMSFSGTPRLIALVFLLAGASGWLRAQATPPAQTEARHLTEIERRLDSLTETLTQTQSELRQSLLEIQRLHAELDALRSQGSSAVVASAPAAPASVAPSAQPSSSAGTGGSLSNRVESLEEQQEILQGEVKQHEQTKVETESKYSLKVTGLVLFNASSNAGVVDDAELPEYALPRPAGSSHGSLSATLRQTVLGLDASGPVIAGARTSAFVNADFFGGMDTSAFGYMSPSGYLRMRDAEFGLDWRRTSLRAGYTEPLISPWSSSSYATVAEPSLAGSGNLWTWSPQLRIDEGIPLTSRSSLHLEAGLIDPSASNFTSIQLVSPVEASRRPGLEGRVSYRGDPQSNDGRSVVFGVGGYTASQVYSGVPAIHSWAVTGDWRIPLTHWASLSGELYRGNALGGLGGGTYKDTVTGTDPATGLSSTLGVETAGGWAQLKLLPTARTEANFIFGLDDAFTANFKRLGIDASPSYSPFVRNGSTVVNFVYRPLASVVLSPEYRRILTWTVYGSGPSTANIFTLSAGYRF
jgi:tetrahydromethanopterin S-methyltransferase subunit G